MNRLTEEETSGCLVAHTGSVSLRATHGTESKADIPMGTFETVNLA